MFDLRDLTSPVVGAPMAGGPSTPALVETTVRAGGLGLLAAGYLTSEKLADDIAATQATGTRVFGVNIFVPETRPTDRAAVSAFRSALVPFAAERDVVLPELDGLLDDDDHYDAKIDAVVEARVPVVTFTFGLPSATVVDRLHAIDTSIGVTVTSAADAAAAVTVGADWLCLQGPDGGGHRSTFDRYTTPPTQSLDDLIREVSATVDVPLVAAGGIATPERAHQIRALGVPTVQIGTALLRTAEAGTKLAHANALADPAFETTVLTRAYSGRIARGLRNRFIDTFDELAPAEYPAVNTLTGGIRRAAADDPHTINLWAGTGFREAREESSAETVARFA
ncbi:nitronate monooxygenase [Gordonia soli]|uniref:nitronate monooxygenase n=1 Tax=Gordonia soli TaxID=320799 RepID=UPI0003481858|nr:nitronate monooxygenase [Gordonia soli]